MKGEVILEGLKFKGSKLCYKYHTESRKNLKGRSASPVGRKVDLSKVAYVRPVLASYLKDDVGVGV